MSGHVSNPSARYRLVASVMLLAGLGSAVVIYLTAGAPGEVSMVDEFEQSKRFAHDLELYGGKANLLANNFSHWFDGLWHGQSLAFTVAFLTVVIAAGYFFIARLLAQHPASHDTDDDS